MMLQSSMQVWLTCYEALHVSGSLTKLRSNHQNLTYSMWDITRAPKWKNDQEKRKTEGKKIKVASIGFPFWRRLCDRGSSGDWKMRDWQPGPCAFLGGTKPSVSGCREIATTWMPSRIALECLVIPTSDPFRHACHEDGGEKTYFLALPDFVFHLQITNLWFCQTSPYFLQ